MVGPVGGLLHLPPGVCRYSLIRLTSHRGAAALPAPPAPGLPTGTRPGGVGGRGHAGGGRALTAGPSAVQSDRLRRLSPFKGQTACPELPYWQPEPGRQGRSQGSPGRAGRAPIHLSHPPGSGWPLLPWPLLPWPLAQSRYTLAGCILQGDTGKAPSLWELPCCLCVFAKHSEGTQGWSRMMSMIEVMSQNVSLRNTAPKPEHWSGTLISRSLAV